MHECCNIFFFTLAAYREHLDTERYYANLDATTTEHDRLCLLDLSTDFTEWTNQVNNT